MTRFIIVLVIMVFNNLAFAHQDFYVTYKFGNIQTRVTTGFEYEQIKIAKLISKLSIKLSEKLNYHKPIYLDFRHAYTSDIEPDYFISYGSGVIKYSWTKGRDKGTFNGRGIVIRQVSHEFDVESTLKLMQYAISNETDIKRKQSEIVYDQNYYQWKISTIDTLDVKNILLHPSSNEIEDVISQRTYLNYENWNFGIDYFYQNRKFNFLVKAYNGVKDTVALSTTGVFQIVNIDTGTKLIFDTDSTFYCVGWYGNERVVSEQHTVQNVKNNYETFDVYNIGDNLISIHLSRYATKEEIKENNRIFYYSQTSIYDAANDALIDNLREVIGE